MVTASSWWGEPIETGIPLFMSAVTEGRLSLVQGQLAGAMAWPRGAGEEAPWDVLGQPVPWQRLVAIPEPWAMDTPPLLYSTATTLPCLHLSP